jgi:hypothetical protein
MKVLILSDLHLEFAPFEPVPDLEFDVVILAGDIHSPAKRAVQWAADHFRDKPVIYLLGNHEYYDGRLDTTLAEAHREADGSNVHLLDGDELVIDGVRFSARRCGPTSRCHRDARRTDQRCRTCHEDGDQPAERLHADPHCRRVGRTRYLAPQAGKKAPGGRHTADSSGAARLAARSFQSRSPDQLWS